MEITTTLYKPRPYQEECIKIGLEVLREGRKEVLVACTGSGKSIIIAEIAKNLTDGNVLVIQPSVELLKQNLEKINSLGVFPAVFSASAHKKELGSLIYATPKSLSYNVFKEAEIKYVILDECDFSTQPNTELSKLLKELKIKSALGLTATPLYLNQTLDGAVTKIMTRVKGKFFNDICHVVQIKDIVEQGFWSDIKYYNVFDKEGYNYLKLNESGSDYTDESKKTFFDKMSLADKVTQFLKRLPHGEDALVFVPSIENAEELQKLVTNSVIVHSKLTKKEREENVNGFLNGRYSVAITPIALAVGFDKPSLKNVIDCTPTNSIRLFIQKVGRGVRLHEGKKFFRYIDFSGNFETFGDVRDLNFENIENYGWGMFSNDVLITDVPLKEKSKITKNSLKKFGKPNFIYTFGTNNPGDKKLPFGQFKGKTVKELYLKKRYYLKYLFESGFTHEDKELERQINSIWNSN